MQKGNKKPKKENPKIQEYDNPFDDIFFWFSLATTDFTFGLFADSKESEDENQTAREAGN